MLGGGGSVALEVFYVYLGHTPEGIILYIRYCITCLKLFSNR